MVTKTSKKILTILLIVLILTAITIGGYFLFRYLFPTDKELFVQAHINTIESHDTEEPERFTKNTQISFDTDGDFSSKRATEKIGTLNLLLNNVKYGDDKTTFEANINFMDNVLLSSKAVKVDDTEVVTIPQFSDVSYAAESYEDVLSLFLGSDKTEDVEIFENVDEERFKLYLGKYSKEIYNNVPDNAFTAVKDGKIKTITLNTDLNRALYSVLTEIRNDAQLRDFTYEQSKIIAKNINKKYPYMGEVVTIPDKDEYYENYEKKIDEFIKSIENSHIITTIKVNQKRQIIEESISIKSGEAEQCSFFFDDDSFNFVSYDEGKALFKIDSDSKKDGTTTTKKTKLSFDVNDFTKGKSENQKLIILDINSFTDTYVSGDVTLPQNYEDIRKMSEEEKTKVTQNASQKFMGLITTLTLELFS